MRIKILLLGDDPISLMTDGLLLRERGLMVYTAFNLDNMSELIKEVQPDVIFFDPHSSNNKITDVYNDLVGSIYYTHIPVIYTLSEDDVYLVTRKRTTTKAKRNMISDNILDALKLALYNNNNSAKNTLHKKVNKMRPPATMPSAASSNA